MDVQAFSTTRSARTVILLGCLLALLGAWLPWNSTPPPGLQWAFSAIFLCLASFTLGMRLTWRWGLCSLTTGFVSSILLIALRSQIVEPGIGLYLLPAGAALACVGGLMVLAYPAKPLNKSQTMDQQSLRVE